ncbi:HTH_Tnp_Tc3_2 domain-containing protein [Trichonephila clavipes]|nr:HTH_Tnp_Tc3_2 domain-containing protein [Trichonephila clavipes]
MWSNESRFKLHHVDGRTRIWRKQNENTSPICITRTLQGDGGSIMVWRKFFWHYMGLLIRVEERLNAKRNERFIKGHVHSFVLIKCPARVACIKEDKASFYTARIALRWL